MHRSCKPFQTHSIYRFLFIAFTLVAHLIPAFRRHIGFKVLHLTAKEFNCTSVYQVRNKWMLSVDVIKIQLKHKPLKLFVFYSVTQNSICFANKMKLINAYVFPVNALRSF